MPGVPGAAACWLVGSADAPLLMKTPVIYQDSVYFNWMSGRYTKIALAVSATIAAVLFLPQYFITENASMAGVELADTQAPDAWEYGIRGDNSTTFYYETEHDNCTVYTERATGEDGPAVHRLTFWCYHDRPENEHNRDPSIFQQGFRNTPPADFEFAMDNATNCDYTITYDNHTHSNASIYLPNKLRVDLICSKPP